MAETYVYRHLWEIADDSLPMSALTAEASRQLSTILGLKGVRPTARPRFQVDEDVLLCEVPVLRLARDEPADDVDETAVRALIAIGKPDGHIAAELGCARSAVERIRGEVEKEQVPEPAVAGVT